jgi:hypothetical protein
MTTATKLTERSQTEVEMAAMLRRTIMEEIEKRKLSHEDLASILLIHPFGVQALMGHRWGLSRCIRIADALGIPVRIKLAGVQS